MDIKFLGTGGAFDYKKGSSAALVTLGDKTRVLIDAGPTVYPALCEHGLIDDIDHILLTHLHGDHVGSLFQLLMYRYHVCGRVTTILLPDNENYVDDLRALLRVQFVDPEAVELRSLDAVSGIGALDTFGLHIPGLMSYAYYFTDGDELIYYSGDIATPEPAAGFLKSRSETHIRVFHEVIHTPNPVHVYYKDLEAALSGYEVYGYHCDASHFPEDLALPLVENCPEYMLG